MRHVRRGLGERDLSYRFVGAWELPSTARNTIFILLDSARAGKGQGEGGECKDSPLLLLARFALVAAVLSSNHGGRDEVTPDHPALI